MGKVARRLKWILWEADMTYTELLLSFCYIGWACVLLFANTALFHTSKSLQPLQQVALQEVWGVIFLITGLLKLFGALLPNRLIAALGALMGTAIWAFVSVAITIESGWTTGTVVYFAFAGTCFLTLIRKARSQRNENNEKHNNEVVAE